MARDAFDLAEQFQTLVFVMSDLDLGMNNWMSDPFKYPEKPIKRGKVLEQRRSGPAWAVSPATRTWTATASATARCREPIIRRPPTLPAAADTTRSLNTANVRTTSNATWSASIASSRRRDRLFRGRKWYRRTSRRSASSHTAHRTGRSIESRDQLRRSTSVETDYLRLRAYPFTREVHEFVKQHERVYVVEQNRDAQMLSSAEAGYPSPNCTTGCAALPYSRPAARCALRHRRDHDHGGQVRWRQHRRSTRRRRPIALACRCWNTRRQDHAVRRLRPQRDFRAHHRRDVRDGRVARARGQAQRDRLLVQEPGVFHEPLAQLQFRARAHALGGDRRDARQSQPDRLSASAVMATRPPSALGSLFT